MLKKISNYFDKLEDNARKRLAKYPVIYALIGGIGIVLFWRGIWMMADEVGLSSLGSVVISIVIMLLTGVFVSYFIGDQIIISGLKGEKKLIDKTKEEIEEEETMISRLNNKLSAIEGELEEIKENLKKAN